MKLLSSKRIAFIVLILLLFVTLAYIILYTGITGGASGTTITTYYSKTIAYMNRTINYIKYKRPAYDIKPSDLLEAHDVLMKEYIRLLNTRGVKYEELVKLETYLNLSKTNNILYNVSMDWPSIWNILSSSLKALSQMDIDRALDIYRANKYRILYFRKQLNDTLYLLENTRYVEYTPVVHQQVVNYTISVIQDILELVDEYIKLMELLLQYEEELDTALKTGNSTLVRDIGLQISERISIEKFDGLINYVSDFLSQLLSGVPVQKTVTGTQTVPQGGGGRSGGIAND